MSAGFVSLFNLESSSDMLTRAMFNRISILLLIGGWVDRRLAHHPSDSSSSVACGFTIQSISIPFPIWPMPLQFLERRCKASAIARGFRVMRTEPASARYSRSLETNILSNWLSLRRIHVGMKSGWRTSSSERFLIFSRTDAYIPKRLAATVVSRQSPDRI